MVKDELGVSLTELGNRLGLIKPTINSYVQGYTLAPLEVLEQLAKIADKSVGWFYFGEVEEYIQSYLELKGHKQLLVDNPDIPVKIRNQFMNSDNYSWNWKNDFGYPHELSIDDAFADVYHDLMKEYISNITIEYISTHFDLDSKRQDEAITLISAELYGWFADLGDLQYGDKEEIEKQVHYLYDRNVKDKDISFNEEYLIGKLINILGNDEQTVNLISKLSAEITGKGKLNTQFSDRELVDIFQNMRPALIKLYTENTSDVFYEWFEK